MNRSTSDGILVFDRYYCKRPSTVRLIVQRALLCSCLSASIMLYIFSQYDLHIYQGVVGLVSGFSAAFFYLLFAFVPRRYAVPSIALLSSFLIYFNFEEFWRRFSYFVDEFLLLFDGRFFAPHKVLIHDKVQLLYSNQYYSEGMILGSVILCLLVSMVCALGFKNRLRVLPSLITFFVLCIPGLASETIEINLLFIPVVVSFAILFAISHNYRNGPAVTRVGSSVYRSQVIAEEKAFYKKTASAPYLKRLSMRLNFYSKYTTNGVYCAFFMAVSLIIGLSVFGTGDSINYSELFNQLFSNNSSDTNDTSIDDSKLSDYFADINNKSDRLNITSPGNGNKNVIRVSFTGEDNIYLRGDIGVDFDGKGWTTVSTDETEWINSGLNESYRPCEIVVVNTLLDAVNSDTALMTTSEITIDYLCETDIVFLPSYTEDYSYYNNSNFEIHGDFVVRVPDTAGDYINSVRCTALLHDLDAMGVTPKNNLEMMLSLFDHYNLDLNGYYGAVVIEMADYTDVLSEYSEYVNNNYLDVPITSKRFINDFMVANNLDKSSIDAGDADIPDPNDTLFRYSAAQKISDFLSENYAYSLTANNGSIDPLRNFLTRTKSGHCSLYATAMTLMLRELDIPARYCTGFSIYPEAIEGNSIELKEKNLHAWVEVYIEELGWVTFDPTAAAVSSAMANSTTTRPDDPVNKPADTTDSDGSYESTESKENKEDTSESVPTEDSTTEAESTDTPDIPDTNEASDEQAINIPVWIWIVLICAIVIAAIIIFIVLTYQKAAKLAHNVLSHAESLTSYEIYSCMIDILDYKDIRPQSGQLPTEFYNVCDEILGTSVSKNADIVQAAAFRKTELSDTDKKVLSSLLSDVYVKCCNGNPLKRYGIRKIVGKYTVKGKT